jgi:hypothetical protein
VKSYEHRAIGDAATDGAMVNVGGAAAEEQFWLSFGDVVALSGDYFRPTGTASAEEDGRLFSLASLTGQGGTRLGTRDEIICALKVATVDEFAPDPRFAPDGRFGHYSFSPRADRSDVERAVRDRYLCLAAVNDDHFLAPGPSDAPTGSGYGSARAAYHHLHCTALDTAFSLGREGGDVTQAMAREAAAQHYLTDAFAAGHLRTPVASIRRYWKDRYPRFWERLQHRVAADTARTLRELSFAIRLLPPPYLHRRTLSELKGRTVRYPQLSVGDLVARCLHDWDNRHGLQVQGGGTIFGDGYTDEGDTKARALAGVRAGNDDIEVAFGLAKAGQSASGEALYAAVREATAADGEEFVAETMIPTVSDGTPAQNWCAPDVETLWDAPVAGSGGTTVGQALEAMLEPGGQFMRQLDNLGEGLAGSGGTFGVPVLGPWLTHRCCEAFHQGFVRALAQDPQSVVVDLVE